MGMVFPHWSHDSPYAQVLKYSWGREDKGANPRVEKVKHWYERGGISQGVKWGERHSTR